MVRVLSESGEGLVGGLERRGGVGRTVFQKILILRRTTSGACMVLSILQRVRETVILGSGPPSPFPPIEMEVIKTL